MDFVEFFFLLIFIGAVLFILPGIISALQSRKESKLEAMEEQTKSENAQVMLEINNILDSENDTRVKEQLNIYICDSCGYVNVIPKELCTKCNSGLV